MRISILGLILFVFSHSGWAAAKIEHWQTAQGSRVYFVHAKSLPMVDIRVAFDAGSARDGQKFGISSLTSALLDTGAGEWNADQIAERFESVGAHFGVGASRDMTWVSLRSLTREKLLEKALATMQAILSDPKFDAKDFEREKSRTLAGLKHREESPGSIANIAFYKALYHDHPYGHPVSGFTETVSALTVDDLKNFYKQYYVASNAVAVIVGDMSRQQAEKTALRLLSGLPVGKPPSVLPKVVMPRKGKEKNIDFPSNQTHVLSGLPGMDRKDPDYFPLYVGNHILGGGGLVSELFKQVREKRGLAYSAYSYLSPLARKGPFTMGLQTRNDQTNEAVGVLIDTLKNFVQKGPSEKQLNAAKKNITGGFVLRFDTNRKLTDYAMMIGFYQMPLDYLEVFPDRVEAVTTNDIKMAFQNRIKPELLQTITVGGAADGGQQ